MTNPQAPAPSTVETISIDAGEVKLQADAHGDPAATPVVLLHGGGQTRMSWRDTAVDLGADGWYALTVDQRGHGDSEWSPDQGYSLDRFADDITRIVEHLERPPVLVGASLGGNAALAALGRRPDLALGLVLVDVSPFLQPQGTDRIRAFMTARPDGYATLDEVADAVAEYLPHRPRPRNVDGLRKNLRQRDGRWFWHWDPAFLRSSSDQAVQRDKLIDPARLGAAAMTLRVPTMLVRGGSSDVLSVEDAGRFLDLVPHSEYASIPGAHHMVAGDDNAIFETVLTDFLARRIRSRQQLLTSGR
ncbi:alpha/beta fold hydrolase [Pseudonocardia sp. GCM10023141]|uniref:alpha/beta fold hydrolase n=1 Tax=Pseudonocardia sp. GCM10023141 TaxID=3252653 RepID=UPI00361F39F6